MSRRILQFGTSRFLQAHVDLFVHEARLAGDDTGPVTIVKTTDDPTREGRVGALAEGYPVIIRGLEDGQPVEREIRVTSVTAALSIARDRDAVQAAALEADLFISNTGEAGYAIPDLDRAAGLVDATALPRSFPAKLLQLLAHRWRNGGRAVVVLPCELVNRNGRTLKALLVGLARDTGAPGEFVTWLEAQVFADSLVDRIVATPLEPAGAIAEPYALWAIERQPGLPVPIVHHQVVMTDDLEPYERLKLHILNLGHTVLADRWHHLRRPPGETVREMLADVDMRALLDRLYASEVVPGFAANGLGEEAAAYVATTIERFRNPFLDHRIADIFGNHPLKVERRITAFKAWSVAAGAIRQTPILDGVEDRARSAS